MAGKKSNTLDDRLKRLKDKVAELEAKADKKRKIADAKKAYDLARGKK